MAGKGKGSLAILLAGSKPSGAAPAAEDEPSACDIALEDAFKAVKSGDLAAFKEAMRDAILASQPEEDVEDEVEDDVA